MQFCFKYGQYVALILIILILIYSAISGLIIGRYIAKLTHSKTFKDFGILDSDFVQYLQSNTNEFKWLIEQHPKDIDFSAKYTVLKIKLMQGDKKDIYRKLSPLQLTTFIEKTDLIDLINNFYDLEKNWNKYYADLIDKQDIGLSDLFDKVLRHEMGKDYINPHNISTLKKRQTKNYSKS